MNKIKNWFAENYMFLVFLLSISSVLGSLYFSEIVNLEPCLYCWWQRVFMYPIAIFSTLSILFKANIRKLFILSLTIPGMLLAAYQYYLQMTVGDSAESICGGSISCNAVDFEVLGFVTIPFLSLLAFVGINLILALAFYIERKKNIPAES